MAAWIFRGGGSRRRRGCHVDIPWVPRGSTTLPIIISYPPQGIRVDVEKHELHATEVPRFVPKKRLRDRAGDLRDVERRRDLGEDAVDAARRAPQNLGQQRERREVRPRLRASTSFGETIIVSADFCSIGRFGETRASLPLTFCSIGRFGTTLFKYVATQRASRRQRPLGSAPCPSRGPTARRRRARPRPRSARGAPGSRPLSRRRGSRRVRRFSARAPPESRRGRAP